MLAVWLEVVSTLPREYVNVSGGPGGAVCSVSWDGIPGLCLHQPSLEGAGTSGSPWPPAPVGEDAWLCVQFAPQPGIWDPEEEKEREGWQLTLGMLRVLCSKVGVLPSPQDLKHSPQKMNRR